MISLLSRFLARFLEALGRHGSWILFGGILLGLVLPDLAALARPALAPTVALILAAALLRVDWAIMLAYARRPGVVLALAVWCMLVSPVVTWHLVQIVPPNEVVVLISFELTLSDVRGMVNLCIPFNSIERVSQKLSSNTWASYGKINVTEFCTFVAVERSIAPEAVARLNAGKVKGKSVKARLVGTD